MASRLYRDVGVVLRTYKLGESDRIVVLLTEDHGKVRAVAKGVRKTHSKFGARLDWATRQVRERGGLLLITARFIPGGRTVLTLSCGVTRQPVAWFMGWIALAATIWASYAALLGFIGGSAFEDNHTAAFLVAFGGALAVTGITEVIRWLRRRSKA